MFDYGFYVCIAPLWGPWIGLGSTPGEAWFKRPAVQRLLWGSCQYEGLASFLSTPACYAILLRQKRLIGISWQF